MGVHSVLGIFYWNSCILEHHNLAESGLGCYPIVNQFFHNFSFSFFDFSTMVILENLLTAGFSEGVTTPPQ